MKVQDLLENAGKFAHWPETFMLYGSYVAVRAAEENGYVMYEVDELMGEKTKMQLSASVIPPGNIYDVSYTAGYNRDFSQRLGTKEKSDIGFDISTFKEWAIGATKSMVGFWIAEGMK
jgi:hypothetical protein